MAEGHRATLVRSAFATPLLESCGPRDPRMFHGMTYLAAMAYHRRKGSTIAKRTFERRVSSMPRLTSADRRAVVFPGGVPQDLACDRDFRLPAFGGQKTHSDIAILLDLGKWIYYLAVINRARAPTANHVPFRAGSDLRVKTAGRGDAPRWYRLEAERTELPPAKSSRNAPPWAGECLRVVLDADVQPPVVLGLRLCDDFADRPHVVARRAGQPVVE